jgi:hypothetical protein
MVAAHILKTHTGKTDANLLMKMMHDPSFDASTLRAKNVDTLYAVVDTLIETERPVYRMFVTYV